MLRVKDTFTFFLSLWGKYFNCYKFLKSYYVDRPISCNSFIVGGMGAILQNEEQIRVLPGMTPPPKLTEEGRDTILDSQQHSPVCKAPTPSMPPLLHAKEDYDSSATVIINLLLVSSFYLIISLC